MATGTGSRWLGVGALVAAAGASLCCVLPVVVAFAGVGSAALGAVFEPFRPFLTVAAVLLLGWAFFREYRTDAIECAPGESCPPSGPRRRRRLLLWLVASAALLILTLPSYIGWVL